MNGPASPVPPAARAASHLRQPGGKILLRVPVEQHRQLKHQAATHGLTLNAYCQSRLVAQTGVDDSLLSALMQRQVRFETAHRAAKLDPQAREVIAEILADLQRRPASV